MSLKLITSKLKEKHPHMTKEELKNITKDVFEATKQIIEEKKYISISTFGTFKLKTRKGRMIKLPKSEKTIQVPEKQYVSFKKLF
ncbi:MAG: HU family DNA-binding protein [Ignavibacterium sp.]|nr:HU family DNA-binding protein [Ignavibacterium sp.]